MGITAILLAAGRGERLRPYTDDRPKCLVELSGMTLIERQIATLRGAGIENIVIVNGYRGELLTLPCTRQAHNPDWSTTNMVETLFCAAGYFGNDMIVSYGDIVYEPRLLKALIDSPHDVSVVIDRNWRTYWEWRFEDPLSDAESLRVDQRGCIYDIGAKVDDIDVIEGQYIGLMRFEKSGIDKLRAAKAGLGSVHRPWMGIRSVENAYMTDLLMEMILLGDNVHAVPVSSGWLEIDTVDDLNNARALAEVGTIGRFCDLNAPTTSAGGDRGAANQVLNSESRAREHPE